MSTPHHRVQPGSAQLKLAHGVGRPRREFRCSQEVAALKGSAESQRATLEEDSSSCRGAVASIAPRSMGLESVGFGQCILG